MSHGKAAARDTRYGRRGGRWADGDGSDPVAELAHIRARHQAAGTWPDPQDRSRLFHPETIAKSRAHERRNRPCTADNKTNPMPCDCQPDPADLADIWTGRARMAAARAAAGLDLDDTDREALARHERGAA